LKRSVVLVEEEKIGPGIVGDGDVGPAVIVEVGEDDAHALRFGFADSRRFAYVGEGAVVIVVIELGLLPLVVSGMAVGAVAGAMLAAVEIIFGRPLDVVGDHQIEPAIFVVVK